MDPQNLFDTITQSREIAPAEVRRGRPLRFILIAGGILLLAGVLFYTVLLPALRYRSAVSAVAREDYGEAERIFTTLGRYRDSEAKAFSAGLAAAKPGDSVIFGTYEQDGDKLGGPEPIEWVVLANQDQRVFVISAACLDLRHYNSSYVPTTWERSPLRTWLNTTFLEVAFRSAERARIPTVTLSTPANLYFETAGGGDTKDRIFLLSAEEYIQYLEGLSRSSMVTDYVQSKLDAHIAASSGQSVNPFRNLCRWWLRTAGVDGRYAATVYQEQVDYQGFGVSTSLVCVRPALWIDYSDLYAD